MCNIVFRFGLFHKVCTQTFRGISFKIAICLWRLSGPALTVFVLHYSKKDLNTATKSNWQPMEPNGYGMLSTSYSNSNFITE